LIKDDFRVLLKDKWQGALYSLVVVIILWQAVAWLLKLPIVPFPWTVCINISEIFASKMEIHVLYSTCISILEANINTCAE